MDKLQKANRVGNDYFTLSGTSMATPICAGVAALILEANPDLTPDDVKGRLLNGAEPMGHADIYGGGYVNAERSLSME